MKVFVLIGTIDYETVDTKVIGVFETYDEAVRYRGEYHTRALEHSLNSNYDVIAYDWYDITEYEVGVPVV